MTAADEEREWLEGTHPMVERDRKHEAEAVDPDVAAIRARAEAADTETTDGWFLARTLADDHYLSEADAAHIAGLDPTTVVALCDTIDTLRAQRAAALALADEWERMSRDHASPVARVNIGKKADALRAALSTNGVNDG
jgi:hypothetical protein